MDNSLAVALAALGSAAGVVYAILGIVVWKHLPESTQTDRTVGWTLWWFLEARRYTNEGRKLCGVGGIMFALGVASWAAFLFLHFA